MIKITENEGVNAFIQEHKELIPVIEESIKKITELFGTADSSIELELEKEDGCPKCSHGSYKKLWMNIKTKKGFPEANKLLTEFDESYWFDLPSEIIRLMIVDVKYI